MGLQTIPLRFRVWDTHMERFIPNTFVYEEGSRIELTIKELSEMITKYDDSYDAGHFIISQDTGLKDEEGKSIYIGDILGYGFQNEELLVGVVEYSSAGIMTFHYYYPLWSTYKDKSLCDTSMFSRKIGNIWENPELLEVK